MENQQINERIALLKHLLERVLQSPMHDFSDSKVVPNVNGIYLIYDKTKGLIYAGQSGRLRRRLFGDHLAGDAIGSQFRKSLQEYLETTSKEEISRYIRNQCRFQFIALGDDEYKYLEHFAMAVLRPLLNK